MINILPVRGQACAKDTKMLQFDKVPNVAQFQQPPASTLLREPVFGLQIDPKNSSNYPTDHKWTIYGPYMDHTCWSLPKGRGLKGGVDLYFSEGRLPLENRHEGFLDDTSSLQGKSEAQVNTER